MSRPTVHLVTRAHRSRYDDIATRQRRYLISMGIRTVAVGLAVFAPLPMWGRALALALGLVLPMMSVTSANAGPLPEARMPAADPGRELSPAERDRGRREHPERSDRVIDAEV